MKIAAIQLTSVLDPKINVQKIKLMLKEAKNNGAEAVFLPEVFYSISDGTKATPYLVQKDNEHLKNILDLAREFSLYLLGGSVAYEENGKILNRSLNINPEGKLIGEYDKMNLFSCDLSRHQSQTVIDESKIYTAGSKPLLIDVLGMKIGISVCFDLRFPELFRMYSSSGANVLSISSAFTVPTGKAHWHTLVRARAIENQCYVIATGQWGEHNEKIKTFGHSLIVDPWGEILADAGEGEKIIYAELKMDVLKEARSRFNVLKDPRYI